MVRVDAASDVAEPQFVERESCGVWLPRVSPSVLELPRHDSLHCPANGCLFCCPEGEIRKKQSPRGLGPIVEAWRLIATDKCETTYENSGTVSSSGLSAAALRRADRCRRCPGVSQVASPSR